MFNEFSSINVFNTGGKFCVLFLFFLFVFFYEL